ncbi:MAG: choice-of-anchor tandem repeat GloVer-containing protein [Terriglobales bacterium]
MNYVRQQIRSLRIITAAVVLTLIPIAVAAQAQTYKVLYTFGTHTSGPLQPRGPDAIAQGRDGNLYTTSANGGTGNNNNGTVFRVTPSGTLSVVSNLGSPGDSPFSGVTLGTDGNFYGTTELNGEGPGTVFKVTPKGVETGLHIFGNTGDGACPYAAPIEGTDGNYYGTTTTVCGFGSQGTVYKVTSAGVLTTLHTFTGPDGSNITAQLVQGTDGNFYGTSYDGGANNDGVIFKMTPSGTVTVLHNFTGTDGSAVYRGLIQASDGNFYGDTNAGGSANAGVIFKITPSGTYTVLHNFNGTTDGNGLGSSLMQATDGKFYGVADAGGSSNLGTLFSITTGGTFFVLVNFNGTNGSAPNSPLRQNTNGVLYGDTYQGGDLSFCSGAGCGVFYSLNIGAKPFINLESTSGKVGSKVGIFGQGFSSSSIVKFNGVKATTVTRNGSTFLLATVPSGASDGKVTVTTGSTELTSSQTFIVHNSWRSGTALPTALMGAAAGAIGSEIYVVGGYTLSGAVGNNQIYNPEKNSWTSGAADPNPRAFAAYAVVNKKLYMFGGSNGSALLNVAEAYDPATNTWSTLAPVPYVSETASAVADKDVIYVIGGQDYSGYLTTVESYNTTTNTWTAEAPLPDAQGWAAVGLLGTTVVAADGSNGSINLGINQGYNPTNNTWSELTADPTPRTPGCGAAISGKLYVAGGLTSTMITLNEAYNPGTKTWATLAPMPQAPGQAAGSAVDGGNLYCFGGGVFLTNVYDYVQIYQP